MSYWLRKLRSDPDGHKTALYEVFITAVFSLAPFIITYFVESAKHSDASFMPISALVGRGQLFLLSYGVYGTVFWLAFLKDDKPRHGARAFLGMIATILILPVIGFIGVDPSFSSVLNPNVVGWSYWMYGLLLVVNYLLLFYMNIEPPEPGEILDREARDMRDAFRGMSNNG